MADESKYLQAIQGYGAFFSKAEWEPRPDAKITHLDYDFFVSFLRFRQWSETKTLITSASRPGDDGVHGKGLAVDFILFDQWLRTPASAMQHWIMATTWPFLGVGIYFDWQFQSAAGKKEKTVGLHVDMGGEGRPLRWIRLTKKVNGTPTRLFYYQDRETGIFYNKRLNEVITLQEAIQNHQNQRK